VGRWLVAQRRLPPSKPTHSLRNQPGRPPTCMPVRIYDIAKKLNIESKFVLAKAKELGISAAKVPSSSLDKITAEYLEQQMSELAASASPPAPAAEPAPVAIISAPEPPQPPLEEPADFQPHEPEVFAEAPVEAPPVAQPTIVASTPPEPVPRAEEPVRPAAPPVAAPMVAAPEPDITKAPEPVLVSPAPVPPTSPTAPAAPSTPPPAAPAPVAPAPVVPPVVAASAPAPVAPTAPVAPPAPPKPQLGEKIGSIDLSKLGYRRPGQDARGGRDDRAQAGQGAQGGRGPAQAPAGFRSGPGQGPGQGPGPGQGQGPGRPGAPYQNRGPGPGGQGGRMDRPGAWRGGPGGQGPSRPGAGPARPAAPARPQLAADAPVIQLRPPIVVRDLAEKMGRRPFQLIADLMQMGVFATVTQTIDAEVAVKICAKNGFKFETEKRDKAAHVVNVPREQKVELDQDDASEQLKPRPPVITIMGHVDHGKTSLLDVIRKANVVAGEAGGITQHIGAYTISYPHPERREEVMQLTFLDTPGHAAFSAMRARGANVTDIVVLVVAANDGVMPQTLEALSHAKAAKVPIIVAVNKCDHPNANPMRVKQQLQDKGLTPDDWGGDTLYVECSALTKQGVDRLIESILLQAELMELKANPDRKAKGNVIESGVEPGGPVATVLVRKGTLRVGDVVLCGRHFGRVRAMMNEDGQRLKEAGPSHAVRLLGLNGVPEAGSEFSAVDNEKAARELAEEREEERKKSDLEGLRPRRQTLEDIFTNIDQMTAKVLKVIIKADTQGSVEAICEALRKIETAKVQLEIVHSAVGAISEGDVLLASSADSVILGFHTRVDSSAAETAKREGVQIKLYAIIYELIDHVKEAMAGLLDPLLKEVVVGQAEVRKVFELSKGGKVAGCLVASGRLVRGKMRVRRRNNLIYEGVSLTLKRFQDEVPEVRAGFECGIRLDGFDDFQEGDIIECYAVEKVAQKLV